MRVQMCVLTCASVRKGVSTAASTKDLQWSERERDVCSREVKVF